MKIELLDLLELNGTVEARTVIYVVSSDFRSEAFSILILIFQLAVYILRVTTLYWPNAIANLISLFQDPSLLRKVPNATPEKLTSLLLEILSVIPEEVS